MSFIIIIYLKIKSTRVFSLYILYIKDISTENHVMYSFELHFYACLYFKCFEEVSNGANNNKTKVFFDKIYYIIGVLCMTVCEFTCCNINFRLRKYWYEFYLSSISRNKDKPLIHATTHLNHKVNSFKMRGVSRLWWQNLPISVPLEKKEKIQNGHMKSKISKIRPWQLTHKLNF